MPVAISGETPGAVLTLKMAEHDGARLISDGHRLA
jgi:hypothetical protein